MPGKPDESELIARITSTDPDVVMPPPDAGDPLSPRQVDLLKRWIASGAVYEPHWAYVPPKQPTAPEEVDAFMADPAANAVETFVDRLLAHDGYGEHQARQWLDLARYADSAGYADDPQRTIWGWRDWVVRAFDANMPFDEFTIRQIAGDLLPQSTLDDRIATAFHRNTLTNNEGGTIDEEFRTVAVIDRVNTTMSTWMGTTMACAQCHDHKYDPLSQKEYFQLYAILNNTADADRQDEKPLAEVP